MGRGRINQEIFNNQRVVSVVVEILCVGGSKGGGERMNRDQ